MAFKLMNIVEYDPIPFKVQNAITNKTGFSWRRRPFKYVEEFQIVWYPTARAGTTKGSVNSIDICSSNQARQINLK